ncbi:unnamed protein product [Ambrosiozyma monospora]|uniref:Unnamed protein product n=1 Tax=Ambrosiozyma monospora TaxID=43982 RepID=A0ACB5U9C8_AMBMO|nr:unnamed protein product [Ambrosiozyma monospora]
MNNINDHELANLINDANISILTDSMLNKPYPTLYSAMIWQTKLTLMATPFYSKLMAKPPPTIAECLEFNHKLLNFKSELPPYFNEDDELAKFHFFKSTPKNMYTLDESRLPEWFNLSRARLIWRYKNLQIVLFRPFIWQRIVAVSDKSYLEVVKTEEAKEGRRICLNAASETIQSIDKFVHDNENRLSVIAVWYATYFLFQAILIPVACLCSDSQSHHSIEWLDDITRGKKTLLIMSKYNSLCLKFIKLIDRLLTQIKTVCLLQQHHCSETMVLLRLI